jgi:hypothetical protein
MSSDLSYHVSVLRSALVKFALRGDHLLVANMFGCIHKIYATKATFDFQNFGFPTDPDVEEFFQSFGRFWTRDREMAIEVLKHVAEFHVSLVGPAVALSHRPEFLVDLEVATILVSLQTLFSHFHTVSLFHTVSHCFTQFSHIPKRITQSLKDHKIIKRINEITKRMKSSYVLISLACYVFSFSLVCLVIGPLVKCHLLMDVDSRECYKAQGGVGDHMNCVYSAVDRKYEICNPVSVPFVFVSDVDEVFRELISDAPLLRIAFKVGTILSVAMSIFVFAMRVEYSMDDDYTFE